MEFINKIICGDCLEIMKQMPDEYVDLIVTSPPYNLGNNKGGWETKRGIWCNAALSKGYDNYNDNRDADEYITWQKECLFQMYRLIKNTGAIFYNHKWRIQNGLLQDRHEILKDFPVRQIIIWYRGGGVNFNPKFFLPTYEVIYLIAKPDFELVPKANVLGDVWKITPELKNSHPAPFPLTLADMIITSTNAEIILDPFMGSGTIAVSAIKNKRKYIGIDLSPKYCQMAEARIKGKIPEESGLTIQETLF